MLRTNCDRCGESADPPKGRHFAEVPVTGSAPSHVMSRFDLCEKCAKGLDDYVKGGKLA